jgi:hypothetical protein
MAGGLALGGESKGVAQALNDLEMTGVPSFVVGRAGHLTRYLTPDQLTRSMRTIPDSFFA